MKTLFIITLSLIMFSCGSENSKLKELSDIEKTSLQLSSFTNGSTTQEKRVVVIYNSNEYSVNMLPGSEVYVLSSAFVKVSEDLVPETCSLAPEVPVIFYKENGVIKHVCVYINMSTSDFKGFKGTKE